MSNFLPEYRPAVNHYVRCPIATDLSERQVAGDGTLQPRQILNGGHHGAAFIYGRVDKGSNFVQVGFCQIEDRGLNISHQALENVHHLHLTQTAHEIAEGRYRLHDGILTRRFSPLARHDMESLSTRVKINDVSYLPAAVANPKTKRLLDRTLPPNPDAAAALVKLHREVFGDPVRMEGSAHHGMHNEAFIGYGLVVRYDKVKDFLELGLRIAGAPAHLMEFAPFAHLRYRQIDEAVTRWREADGVKFGLGFPCSGYPAQVVFVDKDLDGLLKAIEYAAHAAWPTPPKTAAERRAEKVAHQQADAAQRQAEDAAEARSANEQPGLALGGVIAVLRDGA